MRRFEAATVKRYASRQCPARVAPEAPRHYRTRRYSVAGGLLHLVIQCGIPVVTGRKIGLQASGGNESAKHFLDAGVMMRC